MDQSGDETTCEGVAVARETRGRSQRYAEALRLVNKHLAELFDHLDLSIRGSSDLYRLLDWVVESP
jgi:hypothetical protein